MQGARDIAGVGLMVLGDGGNNYLRPDRPAAIAPGCFDQSMGYCSIPDRIDADPVDDWTADQVALTEKRRPMATSDEQDLQPSDPDPVGCWSGIERKEYPQPDRLRRPPGAVDLHRWFSAYRFAPGWS